MGSTKSEGDSRKTPKTKGKQGQLFSRGFMSLIGVSFFGAANDNILKQVLMFMVVVPGLWQNRLGAGTQGIVSLVLTVPFIFLSGYAGQVADKFSKRQVILWVKYAEVPIVVIALLGLLLGSFWLSLFALLLLAIQSSFYGPAKFGVIPDVVDSHHLSQANGLINAVSNVAVILGCMAAGPLSDMYYPTKTDDGSVAVATHVDPVSTVSYSQAESSQAAVKEQSQRVFDPSRSPRRLPVGLTLFAVSLMGLATVFAIPKMKPVDPKIKISYDLLRPHIQTFRDANRPLLVVLFSWSGFYMIGSLALLILLDFQSVLAVSATAITNLIALLAISIVIGSCTVGFLSGKTIRPYFALAGAIGMSLCFAVMGAAPMNYVLLAILVFLVGVFAGFYIVPLQALLQFLSPSDERGRFFGTANALSFVFISASGLLYYLLAVVGVPLERIPLVCAGLATIGTIVGAIELQRIMAAQKSRRINLDQQEQAEEQVEDDAEEQVD